jgi:hypothetical protein
VLWDGGMTYAADGPTAVHDLRGAIGIQAEGTGNIQQNMRLIQNNALRKNSSAMTALIVSANVLNGCW